MDLPFIHSFTNGRCEIPTLILAVALCKDESNTGYIVGKGYNRDDDLWLFWIQSNEVDIDITADQFDNHSLHSPEKVMPIKNLIFMS